MANTFKDKANPSPAPRHKASTLFTAAFSNVGRPWPRPLRPFPDHDLATNKAAALITEALNR
jgi:hypothetical protein